MCPIKSDDGKYPEEERSFDQTIIMSDDKFLLMQQCLRDGRELHTMLRHFNKYNNMEFSDWGRYEQNVLDIATSLFNERVANPITQEAAKTLMLSGISTNQVLEEVKMYNKDLLVMLENIKELGMERETLMRKIEEQEAKLSDVKSRCFLRTTIGQVNYEFFEKKGFIQVTGTNGATYKIDNKGYIVKTVIKNKLFGQERKQVGFARIQNTSGLPLNDAIATVYMHIVRDSDQFDKDKACGAITIRRGKTK